MLSRKVSGILLPLLCAFSLLHGAEEGQASSSHHQLAKELANPLATLSTLPVFLSYNPEIGTENTGSSFTSSFLPVVPFKVNDDWNLITRTIIPVVNQNNIFPGAGRQRGLSDITTSLFFSSSTYEEGDIIWGAGPIFLLPTGTDELLSTEKWGVGPTVVALKQKDEWTLGLLANHIWSVAGNDERDDISSSFFDLWLTYTTEDAWSYSIETESTYDWKTGDWSVPLEFEVSKLVEINKQMVSIGYMARYWADTPDEGPHGWSGQLMVIFLFPK